MKIVIAILIALMAQSAVAESPCGTPPAYLKETLQLSDQAIETCSDELAQQYLALNDKDMTILSDFLKQLEPKLKAVAVKANRVLVDCGVETMRKMETVFACRQLSSLRNATLSRLDRLAQWKAGFEAKLASGATIDLERDTPPCASTMEYEALKDVKAFDEALYEYWGKCLNG